MIADDIEEYEDYDFDNGYDLYDSLDFCDEMLTDRPASLVRRHILPGVHPVIDEMRAKNGLAKTGESLQCPMCGKRFTKKSYQQKFCTNDCKVKYHNKRQIWY